MWICGRWQTVLFWRAVCLVFSVYLHCEYSLELNVKSLFFKDTSPFYLDVLFPLTAGFWISESFYQRTVQPWWPLLKNCSARSTDEFELESHVYSFYFILDFIHFKLKVIMALSTNLNKSRIWKSVPPLASFKLHFFTDRFVRHSFSHALQTSSLGGFLWKEPAVICLTDLVSFPLSS